MIESDPLRGTRGGQIPNLTAEQRSLCAMPDAHTFAEALLWAEKSGRGRWFTARTGSLRSQSSTLIEDGAKLDLWYAVEGKNYWRFSALARVWALTCLALHAEK